MAGNNPDRHAQGNGAFVGKGSAMCGTAQRHHCYLFANVRGFAYHLIYERRALRLAKRFTLSAALKPVEPDAADGVVGPL